MKERLGVDEKEFSDISSIWEFFGITPKYFRETERTLFKDSEKVRKHEKALKRIFLCDLSKIREVT